MRYIDQKRAVEKRLLARQDWDQWCTKVSNAMDELGAAENDAARSLLLRKSRLRLWADTKESLKEASYGKCWFCESSLPGKDGDVDHFRPKGGVAEDKDHPGYWWLAFDWTNFRLACTKCNRPERNPEETEASGKGAHFPLLNPAARARYSTDCCTEERPGLLDPVVRTDTKLVDFIKGRRICLSDDHEDRQRFEWSKKYYNWHRRDLCEQLVTVYQELRDGLQQLDVCSSAAEKDLLMDRMIDLIQPDRPFSHAAKRFLSSLETDLNQDYIREILTVT